MTQEKFEEIEALVTEHQELRDSHDFVIKVIEDLEKTHLPGLTLNSKKDLIHSLYKTAGSHFHPLKQAVRDEIGTIK